VKTNGKIKINQPPTRVLLVDDREEDLFALEIILAGKNCAVVKADSGREALKILLKEHDFAIILIDVQMPMMDGFETAELIRQSEKLKNIPIIFLTANNYNRENVFKGYQVGAVDYILKPIVPEILKAKVSVFVELYRKNQELITMGQHLHNLNNELKLRSADLERSNQELEKFAYISSHDLQEPLRTITSYIQLLQEKMKDKLDDESIDFMNFVVGASQRMRNIIVSLLQYSRVNREQKSFIRVNCQDLLNEVLENMNKSLTENAAQICAENLPVLHADVTQMVQLFQNLIGNAIKFRSELQPVIKISCKSEGDYQVFAIEDNGIGMDQKYENKIFEMFQRLNNMHEYPGTGIGLAICKKIIERHGGRIWMKSEKGKGTIFYFTIRKDLPVHLEAGLDGQAATA
jgi:signal transduction histidine kinase